ncbi:hypothetical protein HYW32_03260 [Candidatus Berkelbacteria bacterium]|nr:hypothetical protein [Candidatus Berkelbacteria bacterium]
MEKKDKQKDFQRLFDEIELQILYAETPIQLSSALAKITKNNRLIQRNLHRLYDIASPARILGLVLRGYEIPDALTRLESNRSLLDLNRTLETLSRTALKEQIWLMLAQQREVLLAQIEQDLETLVLRSSDQRAIASRKQILLATYELIQENTKIAVEKVFGRALSVEG